MFFSFFSTIFSCVCLKVCLTDESFICQFFGSCTKMTFCAIALLSLTFQRLIEIGGSKNGTFKVILSPTDSISWLPFPLCQSVSQCCALKLPRQLIQLSSKLICLRATFSCPFTPFSSFINLIAHSLISPSLSPLAHPGGKHCEGESAD